MSKKIIPKGDKSREAIDALRGYVGGVVDLLLYYYLDLIFLESYGLVSIISGTTTNLQHHPLQVARLLGNTHVIAKYAFEWLNRKWDFILKNQSFLLKCPSFYKNSIEQKRIAENDSFINKLIDLLQAILPAMGFNNENQLRQLLNNMRETKY
jgi:hypothetical protein